MPRKKIIIIEDDLVLLETIQEILSSEGYECLALSGTAHVFSKIEAFMPDLFLIDYMLTDWNGGELSGAIRELDKFKKTPIILMSAYVKIISSMDEFGCNAILEKPFDINSLSRLIKSLLNEPVRKSGLFPKIKTIIRKR